MLANFTDSCSKVIVMIAAGSIRPEVCLCDLGLNGFSCFQEMADNGKHSKPILGAAVKQVNVRGNFKIMLCIRCRNNPVQAMLAVPFRLFLTIFFFFGRISLPSP